LPETALGAGARGDVQAAERALQEAFARAQPGMSPLEQRLRAAGPPIQLYRGLNTSYFYGDPLLASPHPTGEWQTPLDPEAMRFAREEAAKKMQLSATLAAMNNYPTAYQGQAHLLGEQARLSAEFGPAKLRRDAWQSGYAQEMARSGDPVRAAHAGDVMAAGIPDVVVPFGTPGAAPGEQRPTNPLEAGGVRPPANHIAAMQGGAVGVMPARAAQLLKDNKVTPEPGKPATSLNAEALANVLPGDQEFAAKGGPEIAAELLNMGLAPEQLLRDLDKQLITYHNEATSFEPEGQYGPYKVKATYGETRPLLGLPSKRVQTGYVVEGGGQDRWYPLGNTILNVNRFSDWMPTVREETKGQYKDKAALLAALRAQLAKRMSAPPLPPAAPR
jgi:hypothetical protein